MLLKSNSSNSDEQNKFQNSFKFLRKMLDKIISITVCSSGEDLHKLQPSKTLKFSLSLNFFSLVIFFGLLVMCTNNFHIVISKAGQDALNKNKQNSFYLMNGAYIDIMLNLMLYFLYDRASSSLRKSRCYTNK